MNNFKKLSRYELKYSLPVNKVDSILSFINDYCEMDAYSKKNKDGFYIVNSLYLDTIKNNFYLNKKNSEKFRFNMRIRSYGKTPKLPYFGEIKYKINGFVEKYRVVIDRNILEYLSGNFELSETEKPFFEQYFRFLPEPKIFTQYQRLAYFSVFDEYARVTFDKNLKSALSDRWDVDPSNYNLSNYDSEDIFLHKSDFVLELKCYKNQVPNWFKTMIIKFNLKKISFSKYVNSIDYEKNNNGVYFI